MRMTGAAKRATACRVQVLDRAFTILNALAEDGPELGLAEFSGRLRLHKSTVYRLLMMLEQNRYVEKNSSGAKYWLSWNAQELAKYSDFLKMVMCHNCAGERLARYVDHQTSAAFADFPKDSDLAGHRHRPPDRQQSQQEHAARNHGRGHGRVSPGLRAWCSRADIRRSSWPT